MYGTYDVSKGTVTITVDEKGDHHITQTTTDEAGNTIYATNKEGDTVKDLIDNDITLTGTTGSNTVTIDSGKEGNTAKVTLDNVSLSVSDYQTTDSPLTVRGEGKTELELNGSNRLNGNGTSAAGLRKEGTGNLTIKDDVNDNRTAKTGEETDTTGSLTATGGYYGGAGIGGGGNSNQDGTCTVSNITIEGDANVIAKGGWMSAGIGGGGSSGSEDGGSGSNITITGGEVTAIGGETGGAGIGGGGSSGGNGGDGANITITGGTVTAGPDGKSGLCEKYGTGPGTGGPCDSRHAGRPRAGRDPGHRPGRGHHRDSG